MFKLIHGPVSFYFCNDDHALEWLDYRHSCPVISNVLKMNPSERTKILGDSTIDEWVAEQLNLMKAQQDALSNTGDSSHGVCDVVSGEMPVQENT